MFKGSLVALITPMRNDGSVDEKAYDGFGNIVSETSPGNGDKLGFTGRVYVSEIGLDYNRARYYDPVVGRWTSQDPLGFDAGDLFFQEGAAVFHLFLLDGIEAAGAVFGWARRARTVGGTDAGSTSFRFVSLSVRMTTWCRY